ncbi:MAG: hypothetical protein K2W94_05595 [Alphaproteobacteria bacterium]|nr:hypothetical protein [Alphaproteobacteria bacterium]
MKLKIISIFLFLSIVSVPGYASEFEGLDSGSAARSIRWIDAIETRANSIREQIVGGQKITVNFCVGMRPHEADHLNDEYLNSLYGPNQVNFFVDCWEHKHPSETEPCKENYTEDRFRIYEDDLLRYRENYEGNF